MMNTHSIQARRVRAKASKTPLLDALAVTKPVTIPQPASALEAAILWQLRIDGTLPPPEREVRVSPARRWRFDFAWPQYRVALECEGGTFTAGRHTRAAGYAADCEKYTEAALLGWLVIRATKQQIDNGAALAWVKRAIAVRSGDLPLEARRALAASGM